ncbi:hypothetical protein PVK06_030111 [Gossypium arboreum]|uniref:DUF7745 domain-containing protein n=1 Tax=Gossypium arboreum TaxID=29729 RepID=A0ABR0NMF0_GOSAR|nr:hypothetical protein PVK06_030111 [Gossypium arboreum]
MDKGFLDRVENNATVRVWPERTQQKKGDSLIEGYESELWDFTRISVTQNDHCFTFGKVDLVPTVEEYMALLRCPRIKVDKPYSKMANVPTFVKKLMNITGELVATPRQDDLSEAKWVAILQNLQAEDIRWRAPWMIPDKILYRYGDFDWVLLLGIWGAVGYAPLLVLRQYQSRQFVPVTRGLAQCEFPYKDDNYRKRVREISNAWSQTRRMKGFTEGPMTTPEYDCWWSKRIKDNIPMPSQENTRSIEEHLQAVLSELEIIKQDFEKRRSELGKKIEQLEEEKMKLGLDVDIHKLEVEKLRKGKNKAEEDLDSLKTDYKKLLCR